MANPKQVKILKQGVGIWNKWREVNEFEEIDLRGANLKELNLAKVDFFGAEMIRTMVNHSILNVYDEYSGIPEELNILIPVYFEYYYLS